MYLKMGLSTMKNNENIFYREFCVIKFAKNVQKFLTIKIIITNFFQIF